MLALSSNFCAEFGRLEFVWKDERAFVVFAGDAGACQVWAVATKGADKQGERAWDAEGKEPEHAGSQPAGDAVSVGACAGSREQT